MLIMIRMKGSAPRLYKVAATKKTVMRHRLVRAALREFSPTGRLEELKFYKDLSHYLACRSAY